MVWAERTIGSEIVSDAPDGTYHRLRNHFRWKYKVMWLMWNLVSIHLKIVLVLVQYRCTVCAECTIGLEIILDALDGTPW